MRRFFGWLLLMSCGVRGAAADSVVVVVYDQNGLAVAADSRTIDPQTGSPSDAACKILPLGDSMFFAAASQDLPVPEGGSSATSKDAWIYGEAKLAFNQLKSQGVSNEEGIGVEAVAQKWQQAIQEVLEETFSAHPESFVQMPRDGYLLRAVFGGTGADGGISLIVVSVRPRKAPGFEVLLEHQTTGSRLDYLALGKTDVVREFLERRTQRAQTEAAQQEAELAKLDAGAQIARRAARLVDLSIGMEPAEHSSIGGPIDILELRAGSGIRWLQRKASCGAAG